MMIDAEIQICPTFGWMGGPTFSTRIVPLKSGKERRNANNALPRHAYTLPLANIKSPTYLTELKAAFMAARAQLYGFRAKDYSDYTLDNELFGVGDGVTKTFYLSKTYAFGDQQLIRPITKPVAGILIYVDGVLTAATVDTSTGAVTFAVAPALNAAIRATGEFRVPVRFNNDVLSTSIDRKFAAGEFAVSGSIDLIEIDE